MLSSDFQPKRFGLRYNPPTIGINMLNLKNKVLEYLNPGSGKLYHHKMKLLKLTADTPNNHAIDYLKKKHY